MSALTKIRNGISNFFYSATGWEVLENQGDISVIAKGDKKIMKHGFSVIYSEFDKNSIYTHSYYDYFLPLAYIYQNPRILMIGLGGGTVPLQLNRLLGDKVRIDVVDNDKGIVEIARRQFLGDLKLNISISDGARYVAGKKDEYDIIILDAFQGMQTPSHFKNSEFIKNANAALKNNGILAINTSMEGPFLSMYIESLNKHFKTYKIVPSMLYLSKVLICSKSLDKSEISKMIEKEMPKNDANAFLFEKYKSMS